MMKVIHFDMHIHDVHVPHVQSEDCWCEPANAYWVMDDSGRMIHVLEHNDNVTPVPAWVCTILDRVGKE